MLRDWLDQQDLEWRGQSQTVAVALMVVVAIIVVAVLAVLLLGFAEETEEDPAFVSLEADLTASEVALSHTGGETLDPEALRVVVRDSQGTFSQETSLSTFTVPDRFKAGDQATRPTGEFPGAKPLVGEFRLLVIHEPTNTVIYDKLKDTFVAEDGITLSVGGETDAVEVFGEGAPSGGASSTDVRTPADPSDLQVPFTAYLKTTGGGVVDITEKLNPDEILISANTTGSGADSALDVLNTSNGTMRAYNPGNGSTTLTVETAQQLENVDIEGVESNQVEVTVTEPAYDYNVTGAGDTAATLVDSDTISMAYEVTNEGDITDEQDIELSPTELAGGTPVADPDTSTIQSDVQLDPGESATFEYNYSVQTGSMDTFDYTVNGAVAGTPLDGSLPVAPFNFSVDVSADLEAGNPNPTGPFDVVNASYSVTNTGDLSGTQNLSVNVSALDADGTVLDANLTTQTVALGSGETVTGTRAYGVPPEKAGDIETLAATVASEDQTRTATIDVTPAAFEVTTQDGYDLVEPSESFAFEDLAIGYSVENVGTLGTRQTMTMTTAALDANGQVLNNSTTTRILGVRGGETEPVEQTYPVPGDDADTIEQFDVTVSSADDSDQTAVDVDPATYDVTGVTPSSIAVVFDETDQTNDVLVNFTVANAGDLAYSQGVELTANDAGQQEETLQLDGGDSLDGQLVAYEGQPVATGDITLRVEPVEEPTNGDEATITLGDESFAVDANFSFDASAEELVANYTVTNQGGIPDQQSVTFSVNGDTEAESVVTLGPGESLTEQRRYAPPSGGTYSLNVSTADDSESQSFDIEEPTFDVAIPATNAPIDEGQTLAVTVEVTNAGDLTDTQTVTTDVAPLGTNATTLTLAQNESVTTTAAVPTAVGDDGTYTATVTSEDDSASTGIKVNGTEFVVEILNTTEPVEGESLEVTAEIANQGELFGTEEIGLQVPGLGSVATDVTLASGGSTTETFSLDTSVGQAGQYTANVTASDDFDTASVTVLQEATFQVGITDTNAPEEGVDNLLVNATVENTGDVGDSQGITLEVAGLGTDAEPLQLDAGQQQTVTLSVPTELGEAGGYTATVASEDDTDSEPVTVLTEANFQVGITDTNTPEEGDDLAVTVQVENTGEASDTQTVTLDVPGLNDDTDATDVSLAGESTTTVTLSVTTDIGEAGEYTATVASEDDSAQQEVTVLTEATFEVTITGTNSPVDEGGVATVTAEIENTGEASGSQTVTLDAGQLGTDQVPVSLGGTETPGDTTTTVVFSVVTGDGDGGSTYQADVTPGGTGTGDSTQITVQSAFFDVTILGTNAPIVEGESLVVDVSVDNTGEAADGQTVTLDVPGVGTTQTFVELNGGESTTTTLTLSTQTGDAGTRTVSVSPSGDGSPDSEQVTVQAQAYFDVTIVDANAPIEGDDLNVQVNVENQGDLSDTQEIDLDINGLTDNDASQSVTLDGGEQTTLTLSVDTFDGEAGSYQAVVDSDDDSDSKGVTVLSEGEFSVAIVDTNSPVVEGESLEVAVDIQNVGDVSETQSVTVSVAGVDSATESVSLAPGESTQETFEISTGTGDAGTYDAVASSPENSDSVGVAIQEPADIGIQSISFDDNYSLGTGDFDVEYTLENTGDQGDSVTVDLTVGFQSDSDSNVYVSPGGTASGTLGVGDLVTDYKTGQTVTVTVQVNDADHSDIEQGTFTVDGPDIPLGDLSLESLVYAQNIYVPVIAPDLDQRGWDHKDFLDLDSDSDTVDIVDAEVAFWQCVERNLAGVCQGFRSQVWGVFEWGMDDTENVVETIRVEGEPSTGADFRAPEETIEVDVTGSSSTAQDPEDIDPDTNEVDLLRDNLETVDDPAETGIHFQGTNPEIGSGADGDDAYSIEPFDMTFTFKMQDGNGNVFYEQQVNVFGMTGCDSTLGCQVNENPQVP